MSFIYENGLPVRYVHTNYECREVCQQPVVHAAVEEAMLDWFNSMPGQARIRIGKRDEMLTGAEVNYKRLENE